MWQEVIQASSGGGPIKIKTFPDVDNRDKASTTTTFDLKYEGDPVAVIVTSESYTTAGNRTTAYDAGMVWVSDYTARQMCRYGSSFTTSVVPVTQAGAYPQIIAWDSANKKFTIRVGNNSNYARAVYHAKIYYI